MIDRFKLLWCTGGGLGFLPMAPGTWGSLFPILSLLILGYFGAPKTITIGALLLIILLASFVTIFLATWYEHYFGEKDPSRVVSDEAVGQSIALLGMAWLEPNNQLSWGTWLLLVMIAFVVFRGFDIWKPGCINTIQKVHGGWGVLLDDVFAGIAAGVIVFALSLLFA